MKKFWKQIILSTVSGVGLVFFTACGGTDESSDSSESSEEGTEQGEVSYDEYPSTVKIGTASQGGTYYIYGGGLSTMLENKLDISANVEVTGGPVHNMQLTNAKDQDIGMVTMGPGHEGVTGTGEWTEGETMEDVRVAFPMYTTPFHWWSLEDSGVESLDDMSGMKVGVGPAGGTSGTYLPLIHEALEHDIDPVQAGASDMVSQQMDGQLDVIGFAAGIPISAVSEVESQRDINFFGIDGEEREQVIEKYPYFFEYTIPSDTYNQLDEDLETIAMFNFGIVHKEANENFVYELVKSYHESQEELMDTHSAAEEANIEAILNNKVMPLHPGAIKFYEEEGIDLPEDVYPEEWQE